MFLQKMDTWNVNEWIRFYVRFAVHFDSCASHRYAQWGHSGLAGVQCESS